MADRNVTVTVRADVADFLRGAGMVEDATKKMGDRAKKTSQETKTGLSGMAQHIRDNGQAWSTIGAPLTAYGAAVTAMGGAVLAVGVSYNTLRQRSVAALTTLTGSAEAANAQMDKLDDFASNSPFSRSTFIEAQQQLLGFGMAADDVLPTLDSIQNAVAAFGGSNQDIAELAFIIAQVGAAGKITGQDLMQFGQRGVDAATLIGEQMGYTGAEIREQITAGTLDADVAIQALTDGMQARFGGAAANIKDTFDGAKDRVVAAFRDIGASFANVLVDPNGGGLLVDGFNGLADAMRRFLDLPGPIRTTVGVMAGLSGVASLAVGSFMLLAPRLVETWDALSQMGRFGAGAQGALRGLGRAVLPGGALLVGLGLLGAGLGALRDATTNTVPGVEGFTRALLDMEKVSGIRAINDMLADLNFQVNGLSGMAEGPIDDFGGALRRLLDPSLIQQAEQLDKVISFGQMRTSKDDILDFFAGLDGALTGLVQGGHADQAAAQFERLVEAAAAEGYSREELLGLFPAYAEALIGLENDARLAADAVDELSGAFVRIDPSILQGKVAEIRAANAEILQSFLDLSAGINDEELSLDGWIAQLEEQINAAANYADNIATIRGAGVNEAFVEALMAEGEAGAMRAQQIADRLVGGDTALRDQLNTIGAEAAGEGGLMGGAQATLDSSHPLKMRVEAQAEAQQVADEKARLNEIFYRDPATVPVEADVTEAESELHRLVLWAAEQTGIVGLDADDTDAIMKIDQWNALANNTEGLPTLNADPALAEVQLAAWLHDANIARATSTLDADASPARGKFDVWYRDADTATATSTLNADNGPAIGANNAWERDGNSSSATATLRADNSRAYAALWAFARSAANTSVSIGLSASPGRAHGGYTGHGGKYEERGIVHAAEFVHTKENTSKPGMLSFHHDLWQSNDLDAAYARYKMRGYADGGLVGTAPPWAGVRYAPATATSPDVSALTAQVASLSAAVAAIPDRIVVPVSVGAQPVALATRQGNHELGARTAGADAPIYGSRRLP